MRRAREGAHVQADFGQDASHREGGQAWRRAQPRDGLAKGLEPRLAAAAAATAAAAAGRLVSATGAIASDVIAALPALRP